MKKYFRFLCLKIGMPLCILLLLATDTYAVNYYWVGGSGNWSDINHWATTSGGAVKHSIVPSLNDNVIFDAGSGFTALSKTVTVNTNALCDSMSWAGAATPATFTINNPLQVNGSFVLQQGMSASGGAQITLTSSRPNEIFATGNASMSNNIQFIGTGGWTFQDSLKMVNTLTFTNGNLNFNGQYTRMSTFSSPGGNATRTLNIANSIIDITAGFGGWTYTGGVALTAPNSVNSLIRQANTSAAAMVTKAGDVYYNLLFLAGTSNPLVSNGVYNKITFQSTNGRINTLATDSLMLSPARIYAFGTGMTITINKYFAGNSPACSGLIELNTSTTGTQSTIVMAASAIADVANARIRDMRIQGPATPYAALNSLDLGNNTGWVFTAPAAHTYYWVGGTGNWNDVNHWANTSGGASGSGCVPIQLDQVIFDAGSGFTAGSKTVTVDGNAYCDSMTWSGSAVPATFNVSNPLQVNGSFVLQQGMTMNGGAQISFMSSRPNEIIATGNTQLSGYALFDGTGGWTLQDSFKIVNILSFTNGNLNFNGQYAWMSTFSSAGGNTTRTLNIANSIIDITAGFGGWTYTGGVALTAPNSVNSLIRQANTSATAMVAKAGDVYNNVLFLAGGNNPIVSNGTYNNIVFLTTNGRLSTVTTDTLIFSSNFTYTFTSGTTTIVNEAWYASGNPCFPTTILSSSAGTRANISMPSAAANMPPNTYGIDFVRMRDMNAVTGAVQAIMQIGNQSIDNGNNSNWVIIPYAGPAGIIGLGHDTALYCNSLPYTLSTVNFQGNPATNYLWDNSSTGFTRTVSDTGHYNVTVNYGNGCVIKDTIGLSKITDPTLIANKVVNGGNYDVTLVPSGLVGTPMYTLDSVKPAGLVVTPITQASNLFSIPIAATEAYFTVNDQSTACIARASLSGVSLPVVLRYFKAQARYCKVLLDWAVGEEKDLLQYGVQYAADGRDYRTVGTVWPTGSNSQYYFNTTQQTGKGYYRLRIANADGSTEYSRVATAQTDCADMPDWYLYPNTTTQGTRICTVEWTNVSSSALQVVVLSATGSRVANYHVAAPAVNGKTTLDVSGWLPGMYLVGLYNEQGERVGDLQKLSVQ